ncbi:MAG: methenyltetrahydromethanopterin cyclohydrolase, partial [Planctomycetes bacterium]|nr:methenyltetrahydromethanopterin cyclohydrolase [Planctomycetota bacterium]
MSLNERAHGLVDAMIAAATQLRIQLHELTGGARVVDCGIKILGGLQAGLMIARVCLADLAEVTIVPGTVGDRPCPLVQVITDHPVAACMASQYAG